ncbi:hypothetical protein KO361_01650 [Candidatus Woesearchaeota archaeon]|jgi:hypothetical protein|nr:hypothetical protein [Candidatus Woesearchaeota archaeon]
MKPKNNVSAERRQEIFINNVINNWLPYAKYVDKKINMEFEIAPYMNYLIEKNQQISTILLPAPK